MGIVIWGNYQRIVICSAVVLHFQEDEFGQSSIAITGWWGEIEDFHSPKGCLSWFYRAFASSLCKSECWPGRLGIWLPNGPFATEKASGGVTVEVWLSFPWLWHLLLYLFHRNGASLFSVSMAVSSQINLHFVCQDIPPMQWLWCIPGETYVEDLVV